MASWSNLEPTPKQKQAIESYERTWNVNIHCNSKQDAHDVISLFMKDRKLSFKNNIIVGTSVRYEQRRDLTLDILSTASKYFDDYQQSLRYDDDERELEDLIYGSNPHFIIE